LIRETGTGQQVAQLHDRYIIIIIIVIVVVVVVVVVLDVTNF